MAEVAEQPAVTQAQPITLRRYVLELSRVILFLAVVGALVFGSAGRWDLPAVWAMLGIYTTAFVVNAILVWRNDPTLLEERLRPGPGGKDPNLRRILIPMMLGHWVVAGLDAGRFGWSGDVPAWVQVAGLVTMMIAFALPIWAMSVNRFFSSDARIQRDRGHHVITKGPYRFIRHPGYAGAVLMLLASGPALGSYWAVLLLIPAAALMFRRLLLEERLLVAELEGYAEYAARVRYRLVPGLW